LRVGRQEKNDPSEWKVTDDLPEAAPVTADEVDIFEAWFSDVLDQLFEGQPKR
jgi:hypothetical protein